MKAYWDRVAERHIDDNPNRLGFLQLVCVSETGESAQSEYEDHVKYFYPKMFESIHRLPGTPGYRSIDSIRRSLRPQIGDEAQKGCWRVGLERVR
ncbi:MAG: hypothetical protein Ct9H300mP27_10350 [Chloroflexota bacterium]|nr:MAG: hypothetical protein Ct9H300mP27_10350 [Chloroflexota bacterium]